MVVYVITHSFLPAKKSFLWKHLWLENVAKWMETGCFQHISSSIISEVSASVIIYLFERTQLAYMLFFLVCREESLQTSVFISISRELSRVCIRGVVEAQSLMWCVTG